MNFANPLAGGDGSLIIDDLQSDNFAAGSAGWQIAKNGDAEFNDITIRGATTEDSVSLYYDGTPAAGNLVLSIAPTPGQDQYGNSYDEGISVYAGAVETGNWTSNGLRISSANTTGYMQVNTSYADTPTPSVALGTGTANETLPPTIEGAPTTAPNGSPQLQTSIRSGAYESAVQAQVIPVSESQDSAYPAWVKVFQGQTAPGRMLQTDQVPSTTEPNPAYRLHFGSYAGTASSTGMATINHGCSFTPAGCILQPFSQTSVVTQEVGGSFSATTFQVKVLESNGTPYTGAFNFYAIFWG